MQRRDDRHPQVAQQREDVAARRAAVNAVLVLEADDVGVAEVEKVGRAAIRVEVLLCELETHLRRVLVALGHVVDRDDAAVDRRILSRDSAAQIGGEGGDAALARQVVADETDFANVGDSRHGCL